jgi:hypothetical protein
MTQPPRPSTATVAATPETQGTPMSMVDVDGVVWHALPADTVLIELAATTSELDPADRAARRASFGVNEVRTRKPKRRPEPQVATSLTGNYRGTATCTDLGPTHRSIRTA